MLYTTYFKETETNIEYNYLLYIQVLEGTKDSKYLGVAISNDLSWENHISNITSKANRTIGFLRHNMHACPKEGKTVAYTTLVRPSIEYASAVYMGPIQQKPDIPARLCTTKSCTICIEQLSRPRTRNRTLHL